jgi:hypothetical protein
MESLAALLPPSECAALEAALASLEAHAEPSAPATEPRHPDPPYPPHPDLTPHPPPAPVSTPAPHNDPLPPPVRASISAVWPHARHDFPAPNPRSVMRHDLPLARNMLVGPKTDGERFLLFICQEGNYLVNRALRVSGPTNENFGPALRQGLGTLLDCELVPCAHGVHALIAFDCYAHCGRPLNDLGFAARINVAAKVRERGYRYRPNTDAWELRVKNFVSLDLAEAVLAAKYDHSIDGLVMQPGNSKLQCGMATDIYKWKAHHTVDIALVPEHPPDLVRPAMLDKGRPVSAGDPFRINLQALGVTWERIGQIPPLIVECAVGVLGEWLPLKARPDKTDPNDAFVVNRTLQNVRERLTPRELMIRA